MSIINSQVVCACSSACSSCPSSTKSVFALLPSVLVNIILTYVAELNGDTWFELLNPENEALYKKLNHFSPLANQIIRTFAHKSCNYPSPITVGINGIYFDGTIKCMLWEPDYTE